VQRSRERVFLRIRSNLTSYCECVTSHRQASLVSDPDQRSHYPINLFVPPNPKLTVSQPTGCGFLGGSLPLCTIPHPHRRVFACTLTAAPGPGTAIVRLGLGAQHHETPQQRLSMREGCASRTKWRRWLGTRRELHTDHCRSFSWWLNLD
jgi:hypothetical protein